MIQIYNVHPEHQNEALPEFFLIKKNCAEKIHMVQWKEKTF